MTEVKDQDTLTEELAKTIAEAKEIEEVVKSVSPAAAIAASIIEESKKSDPNRVKIFVLVVAGLLTVGGIVAPIVISFLKGEK